MSLSGTNTDSSKMLGPNVNDINMQCALTLFEKTSGHHGAETRKINSLLLV